MPAIEKLNPARGNLISMRSKNRFNHGWTGFAYTISENGD
jgi:hypothetical protein